MHDKIEKIKTHLKENKKTYYACAGTAVVCIAGTAAFMYGRPLVKNQQLQVMTWKSTQKLEIWIEALGDPGNVVQDKITGTIYASQGQAAKELGISPSRISSHLNHGDALPDGKVLERLGKAMVA